jgi:hypothetical protein
MTSYYFDLLRLYNRTSFIAGLSFSDHYTAIGTGSGVRFFSFLAIEFFDKVPGIPKFTIGCKL